jgi:hypothetical protein
LDTFWWDLRENRDARGIAVTFERRDGQRQRVAARICAPIDADAIAAAMEAAFALPPQAGEFGAVKVSLLCGGLSFPISSARLANIGAELIQRTGPILRN